MTFEIVVVGGGIGGLTTAALLAARGLKVCVIERSSQPGGCVLPFEKFGYRFENGLGIYPLWQPHELHERIFAELPVDPPVVRMLEPSYVVRLDDGTDVAITSDSSQFADALRRSFPERGDSALTFYQSVEATGNAILRALNRVPELATASGWQ